MNIMLKYAPYELIGAGIAIVIMYLIGRPSEQPVGLLIGLTAGGAIGGFPNQDVK